MMNECMETEKNVNDFEKIWENIKKNWKNFLTIAIISLLLTAVLIGIVICFMPTNRQYVQKISLLLEKKDKVLVYPNGNPFSNDDFFAPTILRKVYKDNNLEGRVAFGKFSSMFHVSRPNFKIAALNEFYRQQMSKKNISRVDLTALEERYKKDLEKIESDTFAIAFTPSFPISNSEAEKILASIPPTWHAVYSKQEAKNFPQIENSIHIKELSSSIGKDGNLILLEKTRQCSQRLLQTCEELHGMLQECQNVFLESGESFGDLQERLNELERYQINVLTQYVIVHPELQGPFDRIYLLGHLKQLEVELARMEAKYQGAADSMQIVSSNTSAQTKSGDVKQNNSAALSMEISASFLDTFAELIRKDSLNELRKTYAEKTLEYKEKCAELEAEKKHYEQILNMLTQDGDVSLRNLSKISPEAFQENLRNMFKELYALHAKLAQFQNMIVTQYLSSRQFYTANTPTTISSESRFSLKYITVGLLLLWLFGNSIYCIAYGLTRRD